MVTAQMMPVIVVLKGGGVPLVTPRVALDGVLTAQDMGLASLLLASVTADLVGLEEAAIYLNVQEVGIVVAMVCAMESLTILRFVHLVMLVTWVKAVSNAALMAQS